MEQDPNSFDEVQVEQARAESSHPASISQSPAQSPANLPILQSGLFLTAPPAFRMNLAGFGPVEESVMRHGWLILAVASLSCSPLFAQSGRFQQGQEALAQNDYDLAIANFTDAIRLSPRDAKTFVQRPSTGNRPWNSFCSHSRLLAWPWAAYRVTKSLDRWTACNSWRMMKP